MYETLMDTVNQVVRLAQIVGIPVMGFLFALGFILLLTAGKNPIRKRRGLLFVIFFGIGTFMLAYVPAIVHTLAGETPAESSGKTVSEVVDSTLPFGQTIFTGLKYIAFPVTGTMFYVGILIRLLAGKEPQRKRLGLGLVIFSPLTLAVTLIIPMLITKL